MTEKKKASKSRPKTGRELPSDRGLAAVLEGLEAEPFPPEITRIGDVDVVSYKLPPWTKPQTAWVRAWDGLGVATKAVVDSPPPSSPTSCRHRSSHERASSR